MDGLLSVVSYGVGTILGIVLIGGLVVLVIHDVTQKKHTVLRNFPVVGRLRFFFENLGEYFRQYFFAGDRSDLPQLQVLQHPRDRDRGRRHAEYPLGAREQHLHM